VSEARRTMREKERVCREIGRAVAVTVRFSSQEVYWFARGVYDYVDGDEATAHDVTARLVSAAAECGYTLNGLPQPFVESMCHIYRPGALQLIPHGPNCECLGCCMRRLRDALDMLGREIAREGAKALRKLTRGGR